MRISHTLSILSLTLLTATLGASVSALPSAPPPGGYTGGVFASYFKNIIEGNSLVGWTTNAGVCITPGQAITGFSTLADGTYGLPICGTVTSPQYWKSADAGVTNIYFTGAGNVGIGTATPGARLDVVGGDVRINGITVGQGAGGYNGNTVLGENAVQSNTTGYFQVAIGMRALQNNTIGSHNTAVGFGSMGNNIDGWLNTGYGMEVLQYNISGDANVAVGADAMEGNLTGNNNTALGESALRNNTTGSDNIAIGRYADVPSPTSSNQLSIGNWIYGQSGNIGIGTGTALTAKLTVAGQVQITGGTPGAGKVLTSNAVGLASWTTPSGGVTGGQTNYGARWLTATTLGTGSVFDNGTNVGIGTATPGVKLDVAGPIASSNKVLDVARFFDGGTQTYFTIYTKIPWSAGSGPAAQLAIKSYGYSSGKDVDLTLNWYQYGGAFYAPGSVTRFHSKIGSTVPSRIRLGVWTDAGVQRVAVEIANDGAYWTSYAVDLYRHYGINVSDAAGWTTAGGAFPGTITNVVNVPQSGDVIQDTSGNVGIGTTTPGTKLAVAGNLTVNAGGNYTNINIGSDGNDSIFADNTAAKSYGGGLWFRVQDSVGSYTDTLRLAENGNIGIGTSTPGSKLEVAGDAKINGVTIGRGPGNISDNTTIGYQALNNNTSGGRNTAHGYQALYANTGWNNLGIGYQALYNQTSGSDNLAIGYTAGNNLTSGNNNIAIGSYTTFPSTTASNQLNIGGWIYGLNGKIGIGIINPLAQLHTSSLQVGPFYFDGNDDTWLRLQNADNGSYKDFAAGQIYAITFVNGSDRRLKENIVPLKNSLDKILSLNGYSFDWKNDGRHDVGVIAQEVEKVFPDIVHESADTHGKIYKSVEYGNLVAPIIEAIKELNTIGISTQKEMESYSERIDILELENRELRKRLELLESKLAD